MHFSYIFFLRNSFFRRISRGITVNLPQYGYFCCNEGWELDRFPSHLQLVGHLRSSRLPKQLASRISPFGCSRTPWNNKSKLVVSDTTILNYYFVFDSRRNDFKSAFEKEKSNLFVRFRIKHSTNTSIWNIPELRRTKPRNFPTRSKEPNEDIRDPLNSLVARKRRTMVGGKNIFSPSKVSKRYAWRWFSRNGEC